MKTALVLGAGGCIGGHLVKRLKAEGYFVRGVDRKYHEFETSAADQFFIADLRHSLSPWVYELNDVRITDKSYFDEIYQLAAEMGGAGYLFTGEHDAEVMRNSVQINLNVLEYQRQFGKKSRLFFSSSACVYQSVSPHDAGRLSCRCEEGSAYPAWPDSEYGWEKLFSERLYQAYARNYGLDVRIARFHNIFCELGTYQGGREKAPAAICRKVAEAPERGQIELWGDGKQTRSFLHVEHCVEGVRRLMQSDCTDVLNIGSSETISINDLAYMVCRISGKRGIEWNYVPGPVGVQGRSSDNTLIKEKLNWSPPADMRPGLEKTYRWIESQVKGLTVAA